VTPLFLIASAITFAAPPPAKDSVGEITIWVGEKPTRFLPDGTRAKDIPVLNTLKLAGINDRITPDFKSVVSIDYSATDRVKRIHK
jgi:hypothetical protein